MSLFNLVFGCWHKRCSFPITVRGKLRRTAAASVTGTYVVCLDCGREVPVRLVADEGARVQTSHRVGSRSHHHRSWFQGGLRPALGHSPRPNLSSGLANNLQFPGRVTENPARYLGNSQ